MYLNANDPGISRTLLLFGTREVEHKIMLENIVKPGMNIFDIGANIGYYALMELGLIGKSGKVIAIEPSPNNVSLLRKNITLNNYNDRCHILQGAVSDIATKKTFYLSKHSNLNTFNKNSPYLSGSSIEVQTFSLPELINMYGSPDLIRMDVEGHEVDILHGMLSKLKNIERLPFILFETHLTCYINDKKNRMEKCLNQLISYGYTFLQLASSRQEGTKKIKSLGYSGSKDIKTDGVKRSIFTGVKSEDAINLICKEGGVRTVLLAPHSQTN